jgi:putative ABC transport system permease protein
MVKSFARMYAHPASFEPEKIGLMKVFLSGPAYRERPAMFAYAQRLVGGVTAVPGVQAMAITNSAGSGAVDFEPPIHFSQAQQPHVVFRVASAGYPRVVGIPLLRGRWATGDEPVASVVVNQSFVRNVLGGGDPLGLRLHVFGASDLSTIVGVVGDLKMSRLDAAPDPEVLIPYQLIPYNGLRRMNVIVKASGSSRALLPEVRRAVQRIDPSQPPFGATTLEDALADSIAPRRFNLLLLGTFAAAAVLLALIGIYGVMAYAVEQRTHEIGVRMALGARRTEVVRMVMRQGMAVALAGIVVGAAAALGLTRLISTLLFEVQPNDPWVFTAVAALLLATSCAASCIPALRAARIDPLSALRYE